MTEASMSVAPVWRWLKPQTVRFRLINTSSRPIVPTVAMFCRIQWCLPGTTFSPRLMQPASHINAKNMLALLRFLFNLALIALGFAFLSAIGFGYLFAHPEVKTISQLFQHLSRT